MDEMTDRERERETHVEKVRGLGVQEHRVHSVLLDCQEGDRRGTSLMERHMSETRDTSG
jgi:hypothetical protein